MPLMFVVLLVGLLASGCGKETTPDKVPAEKPKAAASPRSEEVSFDSHGLTMKGTLQLPAEASAQNPAPAVVLVHGSGPNSRDEVLRGQLAMGFPPRPVFAQLADALQKRGIAVLRYDKRTCGPFNGCAQNGYPKPGDDITPSDFVDDAIAAGKFLATRPEVDAHKIFYVGHSQGGSLGLEALGKSGDLFAGAVLVAANRRPISEIMRAQAQRLREVLAAQGVPQAQIDSQIGPIEQIADQIDQVRQGTYDGPDSFGGAPLAFWEEQIAIEKRVPERIAALDKPVEVLIGGYDWNVPPAEAPLWRQSLAKAPQGVDTEVKVLDAITHALNRLSQPDWQKITPADIGDTVDPVVVDAIGSFVLR